ncbi:aldehyde dehydrogenase [Alkalihalobacterium bogoriense]|uniref:aldehyde dehydrogenase n=1 Tax=Alkalihalobacterium bogoriense TaxID=246272 RepID=UPI000479F883|nr:aldehyde dehydrogenase [Alkalihalobacterium bogoriense]
MSIAKLVKIQKTFFHTGTTKDYEFRIMQLKKLQQAILYHEKEIIHAVNKDLNKSEFESYLTEIGSTLKELSFTIKHLKHWMKPTRVKTPLLLTGSKSYIYAEPYGLALIIAPWNYPFHLIFSPLIGAIAAGNCAVLKPSELTPETSTVVAKIIHNTFPEEYITVVEGGVEESTALLKEKFDYIFYTGSTHVGKIVMEAASKHLTPVTLELGGKSPCIVHKDANLEIAAKRIVFGKFLNAGQTCIAPDYLYIHKTKKEEFITKIIENIEEMYNQRLENGEFTKIINARHFERLQSYLEGHQIRYGKDRDETTLTFPPTLLDNIKWEDKIMQDEIFGPILPIIEFEQIDDVVKAINEQAKPLALYLFTESKEIQQQVLRDVSFGGGCINDTIFQLATPYLPFGGVGDSGIGGYHGQASFDTFSHKKSVLKQTTAFDFSVRYPHKKHSLSLIKRFFK